MRVPVPVWLGLLVTCATVLACQKIHSRCVSPGCTIINVAGPAIIDAAGHKWELSAVPGHVVVNGAIDTTTAKVIELVYFDGLVYRETSARLWSEASARAAKISAGPPLCADHTPPVSSRNAALTFSGGSLLRLEYVAQSGKLFVYDRDQNWGLLKSVDIPVRGFGLVRARPYPDIMDAPVSAPSRSDARGASGWILEISSGQKVTELAGDNSSSEAGNSYP